MARAQVLVRRAQDGDAATLALFWQELLRDGDEVARDDLVSMISLQEMDPDLRVMVAEVDSEVVGAVLLRVAPTSPLNPEPLVHAFAPHVASHARRHGVGSALMESAVAWAEERGITKVGAAAFSNSRDANRFFARLGLGPRAVLRIAPTAAVRQRLGFSRSARPAQSRHVERVLAARRERRGARVSSSV